MLRTWSRFLAAFLAAFALVGLTAAPVSAHGDAGVIEVGPPEPTGDLTVVLRIRLTFENDAEPVAEDEVSEISVSGAGPDNATIGPETEFVATDVPGVYSVEVTFPIPGSWDLTVTSVDPDATATTPLEVAEVATSTTGADHVTDTVDEADDDPTTETTAAGTAEIIERGDDDQTPLLVTLLLAAVVIAGVVGVVLFWRRSNGVPEPASTDSDEGAGGAAT